MTFQRTTDEILADFLFWRDADSSTVTGYDLDGIDADDYILNQYQNVVDEAIKAGIIEADYENNGWHEGWQRMGEKLSRLADDAQRVARSAALAEIGLAGMTRGTLTPAQRSAQTRRLRARLAASVWPDVRSLAEAR